MSVLPLQKGIIYGPIKSKRLGRSLGINLLPCDKKVCSFDCIYCHYGKTEIKTIKPDNIKFPSVSAVLNDVEKALRSDIGFEYLTFSGNGEPMLHPQFSELASEIKRLKEKYRPSVSLTLLSNSSLAGYDNITNKIVSIEFPIFKLDCGNESTFKAINRPVNELKLSEIISGLKQLAKKFKITIQTVFINGTLTNLNQAAFEPWLAAIKMIKPAAIQIYSTDRPVADEKVKMVNNNRLNELTQTIGQKTGVLTQAYFVI
ncbi:MAG: radical SAM protein [candidate division WOR-3 bacterium]|nr:radical SAM protein [candidate division WOR-3 bacterium]